MNKIFLIWIVVGLSTVCFAQKNPLNQKIYMEVQKANVTKVLDMMQLQGDFYFSYNTNLFKADSIVSISSVGKTTRQILDQLFQGRLTYQVKNKHIILTRNTDYDHVSKKTKREPYLITGYIVDRNSGKRLSYATIYDTVSLASSISNTQGFFELTIPNKSGNLPKKLGIQISKKNYLDTIIQVIPALDQQVFISMLPRNIASYQVVLRDTLLDTVYIQIPERKFSKDTLLAASTQDILSNHWYDILLTKTQKMASLNVLTIPGKHIQVTFWPGFGTQDALAYFKDYKFSLNVIGGYTGGISGVEIGSMFNINKLDIKGAQFSGVMNINESNMLGFQVAGISNITKGKVTGVQVAGVFCKADDTMNGVQISGVFNANKKEGFGVQVAGIANLQPNGFSGSQVSGILSLSSIYKTHMQLSGVYSKSDSTHVQISGVISKAKWVEGSQISAILSTAKTVSGLQIGCVNKVKKMTGTQIGFINIVDEIEGISIGFLSFVRKNGLSAFDLYANEVSMLNVGYRTGNKKMYSILQGGFNPVPGQFKFLFGFGLGHTNTIYKKWDIQYEALAQNIHLGDWSQFNNLYLIRVGLNRFISKKSSLFFGTSVNVQFFDFKLEDVDFWSHKGYDGPTILRHSFQNKKNIQSWIGVYAGIRFN